MRLKKKINVKSVCDINKNRISYHHNKSINLVYLVSFLFIVDSSTFYTFIQS